MFYPIQMYKHIKILIFILHADASNLVDIYTIEIR